MKCFYIFFLLIYSLQPMMAQSLNKKNSEIVSVTKSTFYFKENKNFETQKWRKVKTALVTYKFEEHGLLLQRTEFGKHHNYDLRIMDNTMIYNYDSLFKKVSRKEWVTDYSGNISFKYYEIYEYDSCNNLILETTYAAQTDAGFFKTEYQYRNNQLQKEVSKNEIIELKYNTQNQISQRTRTSKEDLSFCLQTSYVYSNDSVLIWFSQGFPINSKLSNIIIHNDRGQISSYLPASDSVTNSRKMTYDYNENGFLI